MYKRVIYGAVTNEQVEKLEDIGVRETVILASLAVAVLLLGIWPAPLLDVMGATVEHLLQQMAATKL